jgi:hypothetical protein
MVSGYECNGFFQIPARGRGSALPAPQLGRTSPGLVFGPAIHRPGREGYIYLVHAFPPAGMGPNLKVDARQRGRR